MSTAVEVEQQSELAEAEGRLRLLESEQRALPSQLSEAAREADGARLLILRRRREEVEAELFSARARLLRLQIEAAERRRLALKQSLKVEESELIAAAQVARKAYDEARLKVEEHGRIALRMRLISNDVEIERVKANELRQQLADLVREAGGEQVPQVVSYGERTGRPLTSPGG
jgi:hypothetical protein